MREDKSISDNVERGGLDVCIGLDAVLVRGKTRIGGKNRLIERSYRMRLLDLSSGSKDLCDEDQLGVLSVATISKEEEGIKNDKKGKETTHF